MLLICSRRTDRREIVRQFKSINGIVILELIADVTLVILTLTTSQKMDVVTLQQGNSRLQSPSNTSYTSTNII